MVTVDELKYFGDPQGNFKILKPWWDVFTEYLTVLMLMIAVFGATLQILKEKIYVSFQIQAVQEEFQRGRSEEDEKDAEEKPSGEKNIKNEGPKGETKEEVDATNKDKLERETGWAADPHAREKQSGGKNERARHVPRVTWLMQAPLQKLALRLLEEQEYEKQHLEEGEIMEPSGDLQGLDTASGLDTSPEWDLASLGEYTEEAASFHAVVWKAADFLDLPLPAADVKTNILTEVLHPASAVGEPLLPFSEALMNPIREVWKKPVTSTAVNRTVARRYRVAPGDPAFLSKHPTSESLVVQASCSSRTAPGSFPGVPADRESTRMDQSAKKALSSCSMALKSTNATSILGKYIYALMDEAKGHPGLSQEMQNLLLDAQAAATQATPSDVIQAIRESTPPPPEPTPSSHLRDLEIKGLWVLLDRQQYNMVDQWCYDTATLWYSKYFPYMVLLHSLIFMACSNFWFKFPGTSSKIEHFTAVLVKCLDSPWTTKALSETVYEHSDTPPTATLPTKSPSTKFPLTEDQVSLSKSTSKTQGAVGVYGNQAVTILDKKEGEQAKALFEKVRKFRIHTENGDILYSMYTRQTILRFTQAIVILCYVAVLTPKMKYIISCLDNLYVTGFSQFFCLHGLLRMFTMLSYAYIAVIILYNFVCLYTLYWIFFYKLKEYSFEDVRGESDINDIPDVKNDFAFLLHLIDQYDTLYARKFAIFLSDVSENRLLQIHLNYEWTQEKLLQRTIVNANGKSELHLFMLPGIPSAIYELFNLEVLKLELIKDVTLEPLISKLTLLRELWILNSTVKMETKAIQFLKDTLYVLRVRFDNALEIPQWMYGLKKLRELYLEGNLQIDSKTLIPLQSFRDLEGLKSLHIRSNIEKLPVAVIDIASHLFHLSLHNQGVKLVFLANFKKLTNLSRLKLVQCNLDRIPSAVFSLSNLQELDLKENNLTTVNEVASFQNLRKFTSLKLNYNSIEAISPLIGRVTSLETLNFNKNKISEIPLNLFKLTKLRQLELGYNNISRIPPEISQLQDLQYFTIEHNKISELPLQLFRCTKLRILTLSQNKLMFIPPEIGQLTQLRQLEINANNLRMLPPELGNCMLLKRNQLIVEDEVFKTLPQSIQEKFLSTEPVQH
ncbi:volume-regulated anion channel subunit LRRC8C-like [Pleurodeles waltl]|uniref:volume-regulated anion channel subunit LRRC8C-like n=1 Tax=Pleurodeles waltl TaxID=8319 RepID=UPI003709533F